MTADVRFDDPAGHSALLLALAAEDAGETAPDDLDEMIARAAQIAAARWDER